MHASGRSEATPAAIGSRNPGQTIESAAAAIGPSAAKDAYDGVRSGPWVAATLTPAQARVAMQNEAKEIQNKSAKALVRETS